MKRRRMLDFYTRSKTVLGRGEFGVTFLCTELATGHQYACKCISKCEPYQTLDMVQQEIDILWWISLREHPNIVSTKDVFEDIIYINITMELCEGGTVINRMEENGTTFGEPRIAQMMKEIVSALEACHSFGIVHRDLKLNNLVFQTKDKDSPIKVIDFGMAQVFEQDEVLTDVVGCPMYVAPEVIIHNHGPKADIYSVGVILIALLTDYYSFDGNTGVETEEDIFEMEYESDEDIFEMEFESDKDDWLGISEGAKDLFLKMTTFNVNERLSALEVLEHPWILENVK